MFDTIPDMLTRGKLFIIWGTLWPVMEFPWAYGYEPSRGLLGSLGLMRASMFGSLIDYAWVVTIGLAMIGLGVSTHVLTTPRPAALRGETVGTPHRAGEEPSPHRGEGGAEGSG